MPNLDQCIGCPGGKQVPAAPGIVGTMIRYGIHTMHTFIADTRRQALGKLRHRVILLARRTALESQSP
jgi:hypothetical protein